MDIEEDDPARGKLAEAVGPLDVNRLAPIPVGNPSGFRGPISSTSFPSLITTGYDLRE